MSSKKLTNNDAATNSVKKQTSSKSALSPASPLLLKLDQVAALLNIGPKAALRLLAEYGIQPIPFGRGRGNGLRWHIDSVTQLAGILHTNAQAKSPQPKPVKTPSRFSVRGKTAAQLLAEFNESVETRVEVCNGN